MDGDRAIDDLAVVIHICEHLGPQWAGEFDGLDVRTTAAGGAELVGRLPDQAALLGVLARLHNLNLTLVEVRVHRHTAPTPTH